VAGLRVDTALLPDLYTGRTPLAASRLHALNPAIALPARLVGVTAAGDGVQTRRLTGYLAGAAPPRWTAGAADALSVALPGGNMQVLAGASAVAAELSAAPSAGGGYLGYLDVATANPLRAAGRRCRRRRRVTAGSPLASGVHAVRGFALSLQRL